MVKKFRPVLSIVLVLLALSAGVYYLARHPRLLTQLAHIPVTISLEVLALYTVLFGTLLLILSATLRICDLSLPWRENSALNAHTLFINFFMPGQGGPAYRGVYLNRKYKLRAKDYVVVTLLYYVFYGIVSVLLALAGSRPWWQTISLTALIAALGIVAFKLYSRRFTDGKGTFRFNPRNISFLAGATAVQTLVQAAIYAVELHAVGHHIGTAQIITYTGTANLALFAALTPGAIGIRESFLVFTERLHHISSSTIVLANVIDRSVYIGFLLILTTVTIGLHVHGKLRLSKLPAIIKAETDPATLAQGKEHDR